MPLKGRPGAAGRCPVCLFLFHSALSSYYWVHVSCLLALGAASDPAAKSKHGQSNVNMHSGRQGACTACVHVCTVCRSTCAACALGALLERTCTCTVLDHQPHKGEQHTASWVQTNNLASGLKRRAPSPHPCSPLHLIAAEMSVERSYIVGRARALRNIGGRDGAINGLHAATATSTCACKPHTLPRMELESQ